MVTADSDDESDRPSRPMIPSDILHGVFTCCHGSVFVNGWDRSEGETLRRVYFSDDPTVTQRIRNHREMGRGFAVAQFEHHGIPYDANASEKVLLDQFETSFHEGKFHNPIPAAVQAIYDTMRAQWEAVSAPYEEACRADREKEAQWTEDKWKSKRTLRAQAIFDSLRFWRTYYLDSNGRPDRTRMPDLLTLKDMPSHWPNERFWERIPIPGLSRASYEWCGKHDVPGHRCMPQTVWIGWDAAEVERAKAEFIASLDSKGTVSLARAEIERYEAHLEYLSLPREAPTVCGHYLLRCPNLEAEIPPETREGVYLRISLRPNLPMGVFKGSLSYKYDYTGSFEGEFLLSADLDLLQSCFTGREDDESYDGPTDDEPGRSGLGKRGENPKLYKAREGDREVPLLYHVMWLRTTAGGDEDWSFDSNGFDEVENEGRLLFEDESLTRFGAEMSIPFSLGMSYFGGGQVTGPGLKGLGDTGASRREV